MLELLGQKTGLGVSQCYYVNKPNRYGVLGFDESMKITSIEEKQEELIRSFKKGDEIESIILSIDSERERVSLGIKQLASDDNTQTADTQKTIT